VAGPFVRRLSPAAPAIPTDRPLIVFDGECVLCSAFVQWVMANDPQGRFRFTPAQGPLGQALYADLGLDTVAFETNLLVADGVVFGKLAAIVETCRRLGGVWRAAGVLKLLPAGLGDWGYDLIARNRYRLFGARETCWLPSAQMAERVI
jgi:predicted DCC family thiol-disulfide oxidoreductase YuxK